jgi:hypothetical protein
MRSYLKGKVVDPVQKSEINGYGKGFVHGPQKLNDGSGKTIYPGKTDQGFTVCCIHCGLLGYESM